MTPPCTNSALLLFHTILRDCCNHQGILRDCYHPYSHRHPHHHCEQQQSSLAHNFLTIQNAFPPTCLIGHLLLPSKQAEDTCCLTLQKHKESGETVLGQTNEKATAACNTAYLLPPHTVFLCCRPKGCYAAASIFL